MKLEKMIEALQMIYHPMDEVKGWLYVGDSPVLVGSDLKKDIELTELEFTEIIKKKMIEYLEFIDKKRTSKN